MQTFEKQTFMKSWPPWKVLYPELRRDQVAEGFGRGDEDSNKAGVWLRTLVSVQVGLGWAQSLFQGHHYHPGKELLVIPKTKGVQHPGPSCEGVLRAVPRQGEIITIRALGLSSGRARGTLLKLQPSALSPGHVW